MSQNGTTLEVPVTKDMSNMRRNSFPIRGPEIFNCLPAHIKDLSISQETFKKRLDEFFSLILDKPQIGERSKIFTLKNWTIKSDNGNGLLTSSRDIAVIP